MTIDEQLQWFHRRHFELGQRFYYVHDFEQFGTLEDWRLQIERWDQGLKIKGDCDDHAVLMCEMVKREAPDLAVSLWRVGLLSPSANHAVCVVQRTFCSCCNQPWARTVADLEASGDYKFLIETRL